MNLKTLKFPIILYLILIFNRCTKNLKLCIKSQENKNVSKINLFNFNNSNYFNLNNHSNFFKFCNSKSFLSKIKINKNFYKSISEHNKNTYLFIFFYLINKIEALNYIDIFDNFYSQGKKFTQTHDNEIYIGGKISLDKNIFYPTFFHISNEQNLDYINLLLTENSSNKKQNSGEIFDIINFENKLIFLTNIENDPNSFILLSNYDYLKRNLLWSLKISNPYKSLIAEKLLFINSKNEFLIIGNEFGLSNIKQSIFLLSLQNSKIKSVTNNLKINYQNSLTFIDLKKYNSKYILFCRILEDNYQNLGIIIFDENYNILSSQQTFNFNFNNINSVNIIENKAYICGDYLNNKNKHNIFLLFKDLLNENYWIKSFELNNNATCNSILVNNNNLYLNLNIFNEPAVLKIDESANLIWDKLLDHHTHKVNFKDINILNNNKNIFFVGNIFNNLKTNMIYGLFDINSPKYQCGFTNLNTSKNTVYNNLSFKNISLKTDSNIYYIKNDLSKLGLIVPNISEHKCVFNYTDNEINPNNFYYLLDAITVFCTILSILFIVVLFYFYKSYKKKKLMQKKSLKKKPIVYKKFRNYSTNDIYNTNIELVKIENIKKEKTNNLKKNLKIQTKKLQNLPILKQTIKMLSPSKKNNEDYPNYITKIWESKELKINMNKISLNNDKKRRRSSTLGLGETGYLNDDNIASFDVDYDFKDYSEKKVLTDISSNEDSKNNK